MYHGAIQHTSTQQGKRHDIKGVSMNLCPYCGEAYRSGMLFCEECGQQLYSEDSQTIAQIDRSKLRMPAPERDRITGQIPRRDEYEFVQLYVQNAQMPILIEPCKRTLVGRVDVDSDTCPDIDLTAFGAREKGVSRIHAAIECHDDAPFIVDLESTNGVMVNGMPLARGTAHILHDGDEVIFGHLVAHIYFE